MFYKLLHLLNNSLLYVVVTLFFRNLIKIGILVTYFCKSKTLYLVIFDKF